MFNTIISKARVVNVVGNRAMLEDVETKALREATLRPSIVVPSEGDILEIYEHPNGSVQWRFAE